MRTKKDIYNDFLMAAGRNDIYIKDAFIVVCDTYEGVLMLLDSLDCDYTHAIELTKMVLAAHASLQTINET